MHDRSNSREVSIVSALFVDPKGPYHRRGVDLWDQERDARNYQGPHPVVAHPPCNLWVHMAGHNFIRYTREKGKRQTHLRPGNDGGCFMHALECVRRYGGVLEHPAYSWAWKTFGLQPPTQNCWSFDGWFDGWVCEIFQSAYGHKAQKKTWLFYRGDIPPKSMNWQRPKGSHQIGWYDRNKPTLEKRAASASPQKLADALICLAKNCRK